MKKQFIAILLTVVFMLTGLPFSLHGKAAKVISAGKCGDNVSYTLDDTGVFTVSGTGAMYDYGRIVAYLDFGDGPEAGLDWRSTPWEDHINSILEARIGRGVTNVGGGAFQGCGLLSAVSLPDTLTGIGASAFAGCKALTGISLPKGIKSIGDSAFSGCEALHAVSLPYGLSSIGNYAFDFCSGFTSVTIPEGVTQLGTGVFNGCDGLSSVSIPESVSYIPDRMFSGCDSLAQIRIPDGVFRIGKEAFLDTAWLKAQPDGPVYAGKVLYTYKGYMPSGAELTIKDGTTGIADDALAAKHKLCSVAFPESLIAIGHFAFDHCYALTQLRFPTNLRTIGSYAFSYCTGLKNVQFSKSVSSIGFSAFSECGSLEDISLPEGISRIEGSTFSGCTSLSQIRIPAAVESIGEKAFNRTLWYQSQPEGLIYAGNVALEYKGTMPDNTKIKLREGTAGVADRAFYDRPGLTEITFPEGLRVIGEYAFAQCRGLTQLRLPGTLKQIGTEAFYHCGVNTDAGKITDIYYNGTEAQWKSIDIAVFNEQIAGAALHFLKGGPAAGSAPEESGGENIKNEINTENAKESGDCIFVSPKQTVALVTALAGARCTVTKADGSPVKEHELIGTGMTLTKPDGTKRTFVIKGDINGDAAVTAADARLALRAAVKLEQLSVWQKSAGLLTGGNSVKATDARKILRAAVKLEQLALI